MKLLFTSAFVLIINFSFGQNSPQQIPEWFKTHMEEMVGTWKTDNAKYMSENETWDAYGMVWEYGIGKMSINGRLYGIEDGEKSGDFWEFKTFWNPDDGKVYAYQFGGNGTLGKGEATEDSVLQTFYYPNGQSAKVGHKAWFDEEGKHHTKSFNVTDDGKWEDRRYYVWKKR